MHRFCRRTIDAINMIVVTHLLLSPASSTAAPQRLECELNFVEIKAGPKSDQQPEARSIIVLFDEQPQTIMVEEDGKARALQHVTITPNALNGFVDDISLGIDRGSWQVVLQTYQANDMRVEFGACRQATSPP